MVLKATVLVVAMGLTGSGIAVLTRSHAEPQIVTSTPEAAAFPNETFARAYQRARFAAQKLFSAGR